MIDQQPPELFAQRPVRSEFIQARRPRLGRRHVMIVLALAGIIAVATLALQYSGSDESLPSEIPTIQAEAPLKQRPEQPGGIDIPHQDMLVFQQLEDGSNGKPRVEHLLPPPETPTINTTIVNANSTATPETTNTPELVTAKAPTDAGPAPIQTTEEVPAIESVATEKPVATTVQTEPVKTAAVPTKPTKPATTAAKLPKELFTNGKALSGFTVQLASLQDRMAAQNELKKCKQNTNLL